MADQERRIEITKVTRKDVIFPTFGEVAKEVFALDTEERIVPGVNIFIELPEFKGLRIKLQQKSGQEYIVLTCGHRRGKALRDSRHPFGVSITPRSEGPVDSFFITDIQDPHGLLDRSSGWIRPADNANMTSYLMVSPELDDDAKPKGTPELLTEALVNAEATAKKIIEGILSGEFE